MTSKQIGASRRKPAWISKLRNSRPCLGETAGEVRCAFAAQIGTCRSRSSISVVATQFVERKEVPGWTEYPAQAFRLEDGEKVHSRLRLAMGSKSGQEKPGSAAQLLNRDTHIRLPAKQMHSHAIARSL